MELQPIGGWRAETGQVVSDVTGRLLAWMAQSQAASTRAHAAANIGRGLMALCEAEGAAILVRDGGRLAPLWMSWRENRRDDDEEETPGSIDGTLMVLVGEAPFFADAAPAALQIHLGDACDALFRSGAPSLSKIEPRADSLYAIAQQATTPELPSLVVPLVAARGDGNNEAARGAVHAGNGVEGVAFLWMASNDGLVSETFRAPLEVAARQSGALLSSARTSEMGGGAAREFGLLLAEAADMREANRTGHSPNVAHWCGVIARGMGLGEIEVERCELAGLLHGMGKIMVPDAIMQKGSALNDEERALVRKAIVGGGDRLGQMRGLEEVALAVRHQGESWNGTGLPDALAGEMIPLGARILAVALRFCAMTRSRAGRRAMSIVGGAFETLANDAGTALDPKVVRAFLATMGRTMALPPLEIPSPADNI